MPDMTPDRIASAVELFAKEAIAWSDAQSGDRIKAMEYYDGTMRDTPADNGRSQVVSKDFRAATKKVLPSITRTIFGSDKVVEFMGNGEGDDVGASQATDYINQVILPECHGEERIRDAIHDALRIRNGIMKWWWDKTIDVKVTKHSGLSQEDLAVLAADDDVEILSGEQAADGTLSVKLRRRITKGEPRIAAIPIEEFFISPDALSIDEATFVAHNQKLKRFQLVAMGYDRERVRAISAFTGRADQDAEKTARRDVDTVAKASDQIFDMEEIDYWECFVRLDKDDDGIAELRRIVFAGGWTEQHILDDEECDEAPFTDIVIERRPHEWQGRSLFDDIWEIQRVKTVLLRSTLDNIYWQNNLQPIVNEQAIANMDAVLDPQFGKPIVIKAGFNGADAVQFAQVPFVAKQAFDMLAYMDDALTDRTGISDNAGGLPPDALQNVTAKASALMEQQGVSQIELMVRNVAVGLKRMFKGLLKLVIQHQDKPRMIRLRDKPVQFDPRSWDAGMDCSVNVGLGAGTRERDMMAMQVVAGVQEKILMSMGAQNPFVKPDQVYNAVAKLVQAAGIKNTDAYITRPDPQEVQQHMQAAAQKKTPEQQKAEAQIQIEQGKAQTTMQLEQMRMQVEANKEREQRDADLMVKQKELENHIAETKFNTQATYELEMAKLDKTQQLEREKMAQQRELELLKLGASTAADGTVVSKEQSSQDSLMAVMQNMQSMTEALHMSIQNMNKPKRVVRDPVTGKAMGIEAIN